MKMDEIRSRRVFIIENAIIYLKKNVVCLPRSGCRSSELAKLFNIEYICGGGKNRGFFCRTCTRTRRYNNFIIFRGDFDYFRNLYGCFVKYMQWIDGNPDQWGTIDRVQKLLPCPHLKKMYTGTNIAHECSLHLCICKKPMQKANTKTFLTFILIVKKCFGTYISTYMSKDILKIIHEHHKLKLYIRNTVHYVPDVKIAAKQYLRNHAKCPVLYKLCNCNRRIFHYEEKCNVCITGEIPAYNKVCKCGKVNITKYKEKCYICTWKIDFIDL
jgi:hypothetical protein